MGQRSYFTRSQAATVGVEDFELARAVEYGQIRSLTRGVYRIVGAEADPNEILSVAWFRLTMNTDPTQLHKNPTLWVSHQSAATLHGLGVFLHGQPEFISTKRIQANVAAQIRIRTSGLERSEWSMLDGFTVTSVPRTLADLLADGADGSHCGRFITDALDSGAATMAEMQAAVGSEQIINDLIEAAGK